MSSAAYCKVVFVIFLVSIRNIGPVDEAYYSEVNLTRKRYR